MLWPYSAADEAQLLKLESVEDVSFMNWPNTALTERLGIRYPIIQAPMSGGPGTPQLVAAVSNAGGLGSLAGAHLSAAKLRQQIEEIRTLTDQPFAVSLAAIYPAKPNPLRIARSQELLAPFRQELGLPTQAPALPEAPNLAQQLAVIMEMRVPALSFIFGAPDAEDVYNLHEAGVTLFGNATHLLEAIVLEESGMDFIVGQGAEAGGLRATFIGNPEQGLVGNIILIPLLTKHIRVPIIAAGGIMDGRGIAATQLLGAVGVQMGTAFLACAESGAHPAYKALLGESSETSTMLTKVFAGRYGRVVRNRLVQTLHAHEAELPGFPLQMLLSRDIQRAAAERGSTDYMALWAGQGCHLCSERPAAELLESWVAQTAQLLNPPPAPPHTTTLPPPPVLPSPGIVTTDYCI